MRRIIHVIANLDMGGAEMDLVSKTLALREKYSFRVITLQHKGSLSNLLEDAGIEVIPLGMRSRSDLVRAMGLLRQIGRLPVDILHAHMQNAFWAGSLVHATRPSLPLVYTIQKDASQAGRLELALDRALMPFAAVITVPSKNVGQSYDSVGLNGSRAHVVYNCVDFQRLQGGTRQELAGRGLDSGPLVGAIGRLLRVKGHRHLIEALPMIRNQVPAVRCLIIGDGPQAAALQELARRLDVADCLIWLGTRTDVRNFLPYLDVCVMPSLSEAFGIAAAEALGAGVPVVGTRVGGLPEVVTDGENGFLVQPGNSAAIADKVVLLLKDPALRNKMGIAGRRSVAQFSAPSLAQQWATLYEQIWQSRPNSNLNSPTAAGR